MSHTWHHRGQRKRKEREGRRAFQRQGRISTYTPSNHEIAQAIVGDGGKQGTLEDWGRSRDTSSQCNSEAPQGKA